MYGIAWEEYPDLIVEHLERECKSKDIEFDKKSSNDIRNFTRLFIQARQENIESIAKDRAEEKTSAQKNIIMGYLMIPLPK